MSIRGVLPWLLALLGLAAARAQAQRVLRGVPCAGQPIHEIDVSTYPPYHAKDGKWWRSPLGILNSMHTTTHPDVVRRFLLLKPGMTCDERRRAESERILRAQPFIADAAIDTYDDGRGGVVLVAQTADELTPIFGMGTSSRTPYLTGIKAGEGNLMGSARYATLQWASGDLRDTYGARIIDYQFLGRPWHLDLSAIRQELGESGWGIDLSHPFFTDQQRVAWRMVAEDRHDVFSFVRPELAPASVEVSRRFMDVGGVVRVGPPGRLSLFGLSLSREVDGVGLPPLLDSTVQFDSLIGRYSERQNVRVNVLWGVRSIGFRRARGFDALDAAQDVRVGVQFGTLVGRSVHGLGSSDDDVLLAGDLYAGAGGDRTLATLQAAAEGRRDERAGVWDGIIGSARLALYRRLAGDQTLTGRLDLGGGWRQRIPLQLGLGQADGGVRGYVDSRDAGAMRGVARLEDRWYVGRLHDQAALGLALFADAGRVWAGDAPFGVTTPVKVGVGIGILAAIPPGSRRTWRVDFAVPVSPDAHARWEIRLSTADIGRSRDREPRDLRYGRERVVPSSVFSAP